MTKLNTILAGLVAAIGFTAAASAQEATLLDTSNFQSTKSRAEVRAEAVGVAHSGEVTYFNDVVAGNGLSRAQVQAEAREALRLGVLPRGEYTPVATAAQLEQIRIAGLRAIAEAPVARAN